MRLAVTKTQVMYVDLPDDEGQALLDCEDTTDLADAVERFSNIAGSNEISHSDYDLSVEPAPSYPGAFHDLNPLDGTAPQRRLWRARRILNDAYGLLQRTRYMEGDCREVDAVSADLMRVEERLRVMALAAEGLGPDCNPLEAASA